MLNNKKSNWYLITIDNHEIINGDGFYYFINLLLTVKNFKYLILNDIDGTPKSDHPGLITFLQYAESSIIEIQKLLKNLDGVLQFDWADFFLFEKFPDKWMYYDTYPDDIRQTDTTVRAVDCQYIYIYSQDLKILELIKNKYPIESLTFDTLENFPHPY